MGSIPKKKESECIDLFKKVLKTNDVLLQHRFDFLLGDKGTKHNVKNDPKTKYTMLAKLMEEVGELSEAILKTDSLQRSDKLKKKSDLEGEFADVIFVAMILSQELDVDIGKALERKITKIIDRRNNK